MVLFERAYSNGIDREEEVEEEEKSVRVYYSKLEKGESYLRTN